MKEMLTKPWIEKSSKTQIFLFVQLAMESNADADRGNWYTQALLIKCIDLPCMNQPFVLQLLFALGRMN